MRFADGTAWTGAELFASSLAGSPGNDVRVGGSGADTISGLEGDDNLAGGAGNDVLYGGAGNDTLDGGTENDILAGGTGTDTLTGGAGDDTYQFARGDGQDTITDTGGVDHIELAAEIEAADVAVVQSTNQADLQLVIGDDRLTLAGVLTNSARQIEEVRFADGTVWTAADLVTLSLPAGSGNDIRVGGVGNDTIAGLEGDDTLLGGGGDDILSGGIGNDTLSGGTGNDRLDGGTGGDTLNGDLGDDTFVWGRGYDNDTVADTGGSDTVELLGGLAPADIDVVMNGSDFTLLIRDTGETLRLAGAAANGAATIETVSFADGTIWNAAALRRQSMIGSSRDDVLVGTAGDDAISGGDGADILAGENGADTLAGGAGDDAFDGSAGDDTLAGNGGDDQLTGGVGGDTYVFERGDGHDTIDEKGDDAADRLRIAGYSAADARFALVGEDLVIRFDGSDDRVVIRQGLSNAARTVETVEFTDEGVSLGLADIESLLVEDVAVSGAYLRGTAGADTLSGGDGDDYLLGGAGADVLSGGAGDDRFADISGDADADILTGGSGRDSYYYLPTAAGAVGIVADIIADFTPGAGGDVIRFSTSKPNPFQGGGLALVQDGADTLIVRRDDATGETVLLRLQGVGASALTAENFSGVAIAADNSLFLEGTETADGLTGGPYNDRLFGNGGKDTLVGLAGDDRLAGGLGDDILDGGFGDDQIAGEGGNDVLVGGEGSDILSGGTGDDVLTGYGDGSSAADSDTFAGGGGDDLLRSGTGDDVYRFERGDGRDTIEDLGGADRIVFGQGIAAADVGVAQDGGNIVLTIAGDGGQIRIADVADGGAIERIEFDDGTAWQWSEVLAMAAAPSAQDDTLTLLYSALGSRNLLVNGSFEDFEPISPQWWGYQPPTIPGWTSVGGGTWDIVGANVQGISPSDGDWWTDLDASSWNMDIEQTVPGLTAGQTLLLQFDHANRTTAQSGSFDVLWNGQLIASYSDVGLVMQTGSLTVTALAGDNTLGFRSTGIQDSGGASLDNVRLQGIDAANVDDVTLSGGAGNDRLTGGILDDTLIGGSGNDTLAGGLGDDVYQFNLGDGQDVIDDRDGLNTIVFGDGILPSLVRAVSGADTLVLALEGTSDRVDLGVAVANGIGAWQVEFADGTIWTEGTLTALARATTDGGDVIQGDGLDNALAGQDGDDLLLGNAGNDQLDGGAGNDRLEGGAGDDAYLFARDGGHDRIADASGNDVLVLAADIAPADIAVEQSSDGATLVLRVTTTGARIAVEDALGAGKIESVRFADGTTWTTSDLIARAGTFGDDTLTGDSSDNVLEGGLGTDLMSGRAGNDTYRFARGDGSDVISDGSSSTADRLEISGYTREELRFARRGEGSNDIAIHFEGSDDQIVVVNGLAGGSAGIEAIALDDDTQLDLAAIQAAVFEQAATDGNDRLLGTTGNDILDGGRGTDLLSGGAGADTYLYRTGDGDDRIEPFGGGSDRLRLLDSNPADLVSAVRAGPDSNDLVLTFGQAGDRITVVGALGSANVGSGAFTIEFADGTTWDRDAMRARALSDIDGSGDDKVNGFDGDDQFAARPGDDILTGAAGADAYQFARGAGADTVSDLVSGSADSVRFLDIASTEVAVSRLFRGSETIVFTVTGDAGDSLTVANALATDSTGIESYLFSDGVTWTKETLRDRLDNRAPVANADGVFSVTTGVELVLSAADLLGNDFDADGDPLRIVAVEAGNNAVATIDEAGNVHYTAIDNFYGPASLSYIVADGRNGFAETTVDIRVRPVATAFDDGGFTVAEDSSIAIRVERLLSNDLDGDRMIVGQVYGATHSSVALSSDGNISFTPAADFNGQAEFSYVANTPEGGRAEAKVHIDVTAVNDAPVAHNDSAAAVAEGSSFVIDPRVLLANDTDVDGDTLAIQSVAPNANIDVAIGQDGLITVTPRDYYWGAAYFDYVVSDGYGVTATGRVNFTVTPVNDPPELHADLIDTTEAGDPILEDNPIVIGAGRLLANDIEHDGDPMTIVGVANSHGGSARLLDNGTILFEPAANFNGDAWFDYKVDDGHGGSAWARATIVYQPVNDRPVANDDSYTSDKLPILKGFEDTPIEIPIVELTKNDFDPERFAVQFESAHNAVHGDLGVTDHGTIIFTPDADYWGEATFSYLVSDPEGEVDGGRVTLWFENVGDAPPDAHADTIYVYEDVPTVIPIDALLANDTDIDRDPLQFLDWYRTSGADPLNGTLEYDVDGNLLFTPNPDATRSGGFNYHVTDNADGTSSAKVDIVIIPSNDDPTVGDDYGFITPLDAPLVMRVSDLLSNDYDIEQADIDGDGKIDVDLDNPNRPRPTFVGITAVLSWDALQLGQRVVVGTADVVDWAGEQFVVGHFEQGFSGQVAVEYAVADAQGAQDVGFAYASVADFYAGTLSGTPKPDYIEGTAGADVIHAFGSADKILSFAGDDMIDAGDGDDWVEAGDGDDFIDAGDGADHVDGGAGYDTLTFAGSDFGLRADLDSRVGQGGFAQGDVYLGIEALIGSAWNDQLGGDGADNRLDGLDGADILDGRGGDDTVIGGAGDDMLTGGEGADVLDGGAGNDTADYSLSASGVAISLAAATATGGDAAGDTLFGIENLTGSDQADTLEGDGGANRLSGQRGDDVLDGGAGDDVLIGGRGADQLIGGEGIDTADYTLSAEGVTIDMVDGSAGGGDALGDTFSSIEIVQGSYHDDVIRGDAGDNRIRGGRGADVIDGRGGFDSADYSQSDDAVAVDLAQGIGTAGEAAGDALASIEMIVGSNYDDSFAGSAGTDTFDGGFGNDAIAGGMGSDHYQFGFDRGTDVATELGDAADIDEIDMVSLVRPKDVSIERDGDDLVVELERGDGFLIDTLRVKDHFLGVETGIEAIVFGDGTRWDRDTIDTLQRLGRFNAADDIVRFGVEDEPLEIDPAALIANDADDISGLTFVGIESSQFGTATVRDDGMIEFLGAPNHNGDSFFYYTVRDEYGRESSARVEVNLAPVNDAPTAVDYPGILPAVEDQILRIRIDTLLAHDSDVDGPADVEGLHIVGIRPLEDVNGNPIDRYKDTHYDGAGTNVTGSVKGDYLELKLRPDYFGPAGFEYVLADASGATSTANVEIYISPVNDAPRAADGTHSMRLGTTLTLTAADLVATSYDIEGDAITFVGLHGGADENPASSGSIATDEATGAFLYTPDQLGPSYIEYDVIDARGAAATLRYQLNVRPLNDPPKALNDYGLRTLEDQLLVIDLAQLLANDTDENGDTLVLDSIARFADNGKVLLDDQGLIEFAPRADYNGSAGFSYTISDGHGGFSTAYVSITVMPDNHAAILRNDLVAGLEDGQQFVIPAEAFGNDIEPDGDVLFLERAQILGVLDHKFLSPDFTVSARMPDGSALPDTLHFDAATMQFTGSIAAGEPVTVDVWLNDPANGNVFNRRLTLHDYNMADGNFDASAAVLAGYQVRQAYSDTLEFGAARLDGSEAVVATLADGSALPGWLAFDPATLRFTGTAPEGTIDPVDVALTFTRTGSDGHPLTFSDTMTLDPAALAAGVDYDSGVALFDLAGATVSAQVQGGRTLPDWLSFDAATRQVSLSGFAPDADAQPVRLQVVFTPPERSLPDGTRASTDRGFTLEFVIDPNAPLDPAINAVLAGEPYFADQGLFALDLSGSTVTASRESGAPLNSWLTFDPADLTFAGTPPPEWVGAVPVRMNVTGGALPAMSIITEAVVDDTFRLDPLSGLGVSVGDEELDLHTPTDFNGTVVLSYDTTDEKGAVSADPALIFFNVRPTRERPDAAADAVSVDEGSTVRFAVAGLLGNDFDRDGDAIRISALGAPAHGGLTFELGHVSLAPPAELAPLEGAVWSATLADGSALPAWLAVDAATGEIGGDIPLDLAATLAITLTRTLGGAADSATFSHDFDGNAGAFAIYTPDPAFSGADLLQYTVTDDHEGVSTGRIDVTVNPKEDPPVAVVDLVHASEDTPLAINPAVLLANDYDVDSDPIRFLGIANPSHGTVDWDGSRILFTPDANFSGNASFEYQVTDDTNGVSTGHVTVAVASTNLAPTPGADVFETTEDTPFAFSIADLMANDGDPDGDPLTFQAILKSVAGGRIQELTGGRYQFVPDENVNGPLAFSYVVSDGRKASTGSITFDIAPVNDAPIPNDDGFFVGHHDEPVTIQFADLIANDRDVEGDSFTVTEIFDGDQGFVTQVGQTAVFTPDDGYFGDAGFHYRITDSHGASSVSYVNLTIYPDAPLPIASSDHGLEMLEDGYIDIDPQLLMANDTAPDGTTLSFITLEGAQLQADGRYRYTATPDFNGDVTLRYAIQNEQQFPIWSTVTISVLPVADDPVARDDGGLATLEDVPLAIFASQLTANDSDADKQAIFISAFGDHQGVTVTDLGYGQLQITPDADYNATAWFDYTLSDSTGRTDVARVTVEITPDNDPPVIAAIPVLRGREDVAFDAALPAGLATDPDGDILQVTVRGKDGAEVPAWLTYDAQLRTLSGDPPANFNGTVALEVVASDGAATTVRDVIVSIEPVNDAPVVGSGVDNVAATEDTAVTFNLRPDAFTDVDGDSLSLAITLPDGSPAPAWLTLADGVLSGSPPADFNGDIALLVTASDGKLDVAQAFTLSVVPVNDAPLVARPLTDAIYDEDTAISLALPAGAFADVDGDALTLTATLTDGSALPAWLVFDGTRFSGTPPRDFNGEFDVRVTANDGQLSVSDAFRLTIQPVNDAPAVLVPLPDLAATEDTAFSLELPVGGIGDVDGDTLSFRVLQADGSALPGWLAFTGTRLEGTPPADWNGQLDLQLVASDGSLAASDPFSLVVSAANDAPVLLSPLSDLSSPEDSAFDFAIPADRFGDVDGDALTLTARLADGNALPAWIAFDGSHLTGTPPANFNGALAIEITASDGSLSASGTFQLSIAAVNDAPVLLAPLPDVSSPEDGALSFALPVGTFGDVEGDPLVLAASLAGGATLPDWLVFDGAGFSGLPPADFNGNLAITVIASDGALSASDAFTLSISPVNDAPVLVAPFVDLAGTEDTAFAVTIDPAHFADVDGDALSLTLAQGDGSALPEWLHFDGASLSGTPEANWNGTLSLRITASDGTLSASDVFDLAIAPLNDAPVVSHWFAGAVHSAEDTAIDLPLPDGAFGDVDGDSLTIGATLADGGALPEWLSFDGARFSGTPPQDFNGSLAMLVTADDGQLSTTASLALAIDAVNDRPVLVQPLVDQASPEDSAFAISMPLEAFADVDGDSLALTARLASGGDLPSWLAFDGATLAGTPPQDFNGSLDIEILASDGALAASDVFRLTISPVNDAPLVLTPVPDLVTAEDHVISLAVPTSGIGDVDGDALTYSLVQADGSALPEWLAFTGSRLEGTPPADWNGRLDVQLVASDGALTASDPFSLTVIAVNDAPVVLAPLPDLHSNEDSAFAFTIPVGAFGDVDGDPLALSARLGDGTALPLWMHFDGAQLTGTPPANFNGALNIAVTATDGRLAATTQFVFTVDPVNDAPALLAPLPDLARPEDSAVSFSLPAGAFGDVDGDTLHFSAALADGSALPDWLAFDGSAFAGTPSQDFNGTLSIAVSASDGTLAASENFDLAITPVNDAPVVAMPLADRDVFESDLLDWAIPAGTFFDVDGDALTFAATRADGSALPDWLQFADGRFSGQAPADYSGTEDIVVIASDGALSASSGFTLTIIDPNHAPVAGDDGLFIGLQAQDLVILASDILGNDTDQDGDLLTIVSVGNGTAGQVHIDENGNLVYSVDSAFQGADSFTYVVSDGKEQDVGTVWLRIDSPYADWSQGGAGADKLFGNHAATSHIYGGDGNDMIKGGQAADWLAGGIGADHLLGLSGDDNLWGNEGDDSVEGNGGFDTAHFYGLRSSYQVRTANGTVQVVDAAPATDGDDGTDTISSIELLSFKNGETASVISPIILDLGGDGIETVSADDSKARFDLDGDGLADDTSWIGSGEAFLWLDRDGNGTVSGASEITFIDDLPGAASDLAGLKAFDSDGDGKLTAADARFADFGIWRDADGDGAVDQGETTGLAQAGIASLNLTGTAKNGTSELGEVAVLNTGTYALTSGATRSFDDAALTYFSATSNLPELTSSSYAFDGKSKKYRFAIANGSITVGPRKGKGGFDPLAGQLSANTILRFANETIGMLALLALDLDGNGLKLANHDKAHAAFDMNGDGGADDTGWISSSDGFLVIDRDNDGQITQASELSLTAESKDARTSLQGLATLDSNGDGMVDAGDARFGELRVWVDQNGNGVSDGGELRTLADAGIVAIRLAATPGQDAIKIGDNALLATASFVRADGTTGSAGDVSLAYSPAASGGSRTAPSKTALARKEQVFGRKFLFGDRLEDLAAAQQGPGSALQSTRLGPPIREQDRPLERLPFDQFAGPGAQVQPTALGNLDLPLRRVAFDQLEGSTAEARDVFLDADTTRKLALIRQDLSTFGMAAGEGLDRFSRGGSEPLDWYA